MPNITVAIVLLTSALASAAQASPGAFGVCYDYGCKTRQTVRLPEEQWQTVRALFAPEPANATQERRRIARAIALMETLVGTITGTAADLGGNTRGAGMPGQMDCIDESTNTNTYLHLMQADGLLRFHEVRGRRMRSRWLVDAHWTAVIRDTGTGQDYAVDSWFFDNGQPPVIARLNDWLAKRSDPDD